MVSETVLKQLQETLVEANDERHKASAEATQADSFVVDARVNLQQAKTDLAIAEEQHAQASQAYRQLLDYYNGRPNKTDLEAVGNKVMKLSVEADQCLHAVQSHRDIVSQRQDELRKAEAYLAVAKRKASEAQRNWEGLAAEVERAHAV